MKENSNNNFELKLKEDFLDFLSQNNYSTEQIEHSYYATFGVEVEDSKAVPEITAKMNEVVNKGLPSNVFTRLISNLKRMEGD